jgi:hypothetical protein
VDRAGVASKPDAVARGAVGQQDGVVSVSAINRLPYGMAFREGAVAPDVVNGGLRRASTIDSPQASMVSWITGRQCVEQRAVQMNEP